MSADSGVPIRELRVDGGAVRMDLLCQLQADLSGIPVVRPVVRETTALGAAFLAGLAEGIWSGYDALERAWGVDKRFEPRMNDETRASERERWKRAVERSRNWVTGCGTSTAPRTGTRVDPRATAAGTLSRNRHFPIR